MSNAVFRFLVREFPKTHLNDMINSIEKIFKEKMENLKQLPPEYSYVFYSPNYKIINPSSSYDKCYKLFHQMISFIQNRNVSIKSGLDVEYYFYEAYLKYVKLKSLYIASIIVFIIIIIYRCE